LRASFSRDRLRAFRFSFMKKFLWLLSISVGSTAFSAGAAPDRFPPTRPGSPAALRISASTRSLTRTAKPAVKAQAKKHPKKQHRKKARTGK
jgi:hypothetical protein